MDTERKKTREQALMHHANPLMNAEIAQIMMPRLLTRHRSSKNRVFIQPRSSKHSDLQSYAILKDLLTYCASLRDRAKRGEVVAKFRHHQTVGHDDWVIDIAIGTCAGSPVAMHEYENQLLPISEKPPALIQIAIELKSIYTEHKKARKNRLRDFNAFHGYAHQYSPKTVAAAFLLVNCSEYFYSPLRKEDDITKHGGRAGVRQLAEQTIGTFRTINLRNSLVDPPGLEALGAILIEHDNLHIHPKAEVHQRLHKPTRIVTGLPAPQIGDPLHYQTMIQRICQQYSDRFAA